PHNAAAYRKSLVGPKLVGERGYTALEQRAARPTLEINGLTSGYQGEGSKTIIPAWASAKLTFRLVPNQTPQRIHKLVAKRLKKLCPPTVRITIEGGHGGEPYLVPPTGPLAQAALRSLKSAFACRPGRLRDR